MTTEKEYLEELRFQLKALPIPERENLVNDYIEHFAAARERGEEDRVIIEKLGTPKAVAQSILAENLILRADESKGLSSKAKWTMKAVVLLILTAPFHFLILLVPGTLAITFLTLAWTFPIVLVALLIAGVAFLVKTSAAVGFSFWAWSSVVLSGLGVVALSVAAVGFAALLTLGLIYLLKTYVLINLKLIQN